MQLRHQSNGGAAPVKFIFEIAIAKEAGSYDVHSSIAEELQCLLKPLASVELDSPWGFSKDSSGTNRLDMMRKLFKKDWDWSKQPAMEMLETSGAFFQILDVKYFR